MNDELVHVTLDQKVFNIVHTVDSKSAVGPDEFSGAFYKVCWNIIKQDFTNVIAAFFNGHSLPKIWTSALIVVIRKVENPKSLNDMPISLYNLLCRSHLKDFTK